LVPLLTLAALAVPKNDTAVVAALPEADAERNGLIALPDKGVDKEVPAAAVPPTPTAAEVPLDRNAGLPTSKALLAALPPMALNKSPLAGNGFVLKVPKIELAAAGCCCTGVASTVAAAAAAAVASVRRRLLGPSPSAPSPAASAAPLLMAAAWPEPEAFGVEAVFQPPPPLSACFLFSVSFIRCI
jgi:hypothetical protein